MNRMYLEGAMARFEDGGGPLAADKPSSYMIYTPCAAPIDETETPLVPFGGQKRVQKL